MMKAMRVVSVAAVLMFMCAPLAHAFSPYSRSAGAGNTGFTVLGGYDGSWLSYEEKDTSGNFDDRDFGWLNGLYGEARFESNVLWTRLSADYSWSHDAWYDGFVYDGAGNRTPAEFHTHEMIDLYEGDIGIKLINSGGSTLTPYAGIGRRIWWRGVDSGSDYVEKYSWDYAAIGLNYVWRIEKWTAGADVAVTLPFNMKMTTNDAGNWEEATFKLGENPGVEAQLPFTYDIYQRQSGPGKVFLFFTPYYQYWEIGASDWVTVYQSNGQVAPLSPYNEPDSTTNLYGVRLGLGVNF